MQNPFYGKILFDLDGTLIDSLPGISYSFHKALAEVYKNPPELDIKPFIGPHIRDIFQVALNRHIAPSELCALENAYRQSYDLKGCLLSTVYQGVPETLNKLRLDGIECYIVTNKPTAPTNIILEEKNLRQYFNKVVCRDSVEPHFSSKSDAVRFLVSEFPHSPGRMLFVGDSRDDAIAAQENGLYFAAADYGYGRVTQLLPQNTHIKLPNFPALLNPPTTN